MTMTYSYVANSPLVSQIAFKQATTTRMTTTKQYDYLNLLLSVSSAPSAASALSFGYAYNTANQRIRSTLADGSYWLYTYDNLGQVISGNKYWPDNTPVAGQQFGYGFDDIGNRQTTAAGGDNAGQNLWSASYSANNLNQYTQRTVPGYVQSLGSANANATVTLWSSDGSSASSQRKGSYFRAELPVDNTSVARWLALTNLAVLNNGTNADIVATTVGHEFLPQTPEHFTYDNDGNLTQDGRWNYTWDAENRLVQLSPSTTLGPQISLDFEYDWQGRRIHKQVWGNTNWTGTPTNDLKFVYDGWNLIAILNSPSSLLQSFTWGLDLSGSIQGAGGVGGLLFICDLPSAIGYSAPAFDGNGNVMALVSMSGGTNCAAYEYGPFGEVIRATGPMAKANPFRFSTKYQDDESDLLYYGYRYYSISNGRWLSRDPTEEGGGDNLHVFCGNNPVDFADPFGLEWIIWRLGSPRAAAIPTSASDTWEGLAIKLGFDSKDYRRWVQPADASPSPCKAYTVPNTIYIDLGKREPIDYFPFTVINLLRVTGYAFRDLYRGQGFNVILTKDPRGADIMDHLSSRNIYGYLYFGHGSDGKINTGGYGNQEWLAPRRYTMYGIARMWLFACESMVRVPHDSDNPGRFIQTPWERNVSTRGTVAGFVESINAYDWLMYGSSLLTFYSGTNN